MVLIEGMNGLRLSAQEDGSIAVDRRWDGPWESWFLEPIADNPTYVAIRSYHGKYISHNGMFKWIDAKATAVGANQMFLLFASETYPPMT